MNKALCRNCKHCHQYGNVFMDKFGKCGKFIEYFSNNFGIYCACTNWESSDNLVYLSQKYDVKHSR